MNTEGNLLNTAMVYAGGVSDMDKKLSYKEFVETLRGNDKINTYTGKTTTGMEMFYLPTGHSYLGKKFTYKNKQKAYKEYLSTFIMTNGGGVDEVVG